MNVSDVQPDHEECIMSPCGTSRHFPAGIRNARRAGKQHVRYCRSNVVRSATSLVSTTKMASKLAGSVELAFSLIW